jgi:hypothetical protein
MLTLKIKSEEAKLLGNAISVAGWNLKYVWGFVDLNENVESIRDVPQKYKQFGKSIYEYLTVNFKGGA